MARDHYEKLSHHASDFIECGVCETNCPFHVEVRKKMKEAVEFFNSLIICQSAPVIGVFLHTKLSCNYL